MDLYEFLHQAIHHVLPAVPWLIGGACVAMVSLGPVGRAISHRMLEGNISARRSSALLDEVLDLRADVRDVLERMDEHDSMLSRLQNRCGSPMFREWPSQKRRAETPV